MTVIGAADGSGGGGRSGSEDPFEAVEERIEADAEVAGGGFDGPIEITRRNARVGEDGNNAEVAADEVPDDG